MAAIQVSREQNGHLHVHLEGGSKHLSVFVPPELFAEALTTGARVVIGCDNADRTGVDSPCADPGFALAAAEERAEAAERERDEAVAQKAESDEAVAYWKSQATTARAQKASGYTAAELVAARQDARRAGAEEVRAQVREVLADDPAECPPAPTAEGDAPEDGSITSMPPCCEAAYARGHADGHWQGRRADPDRPGYLRSDALRTAFEEPPALEAKGGGGPR